MKNFFFIKLFFIYSFSLIYAQTNIKVMTYNVLHFPNDIDGIDRKEDLRYILQDYQPDIFSVCELNDENGADIILDYCLETPDNKYSAAVFEYNHSGNYPDLNNMFYYNNQKFELVNQTYILTYLRDINRYTLKLITPDTSQEYYIEVYVAHLKASEGTDNEDKRLSMVEEFTNDLANIPPDHFVIFTGDFNMYDSYEPAYQEIIDTTNAIVMKDPLGEEGVGNWHNNSSFTLYHTQSTHTVSEDDYVGGGLDDRFDIIFLSQNFFSSTSPLKYIQGSYSAYGNNGDCFNKKINDASCTGDFSLETRNHLYNMSDHLPITAQLEFDGLLTAETYSRINIFINEGMPVTNHLSFNGDIEPGTKLEIFDMSGKQIFSIDPYEKNRRISVTHLKKGIYFAKFNQQNNTKIIRFIKG